MQYEFKQSTSKTGWLVETLVVNIDTSDELWLEKILDSLLQAVDVIASAEENANTEKHWRMMFRLAPCIVVSEYALWSMIIEDHSDGLAVLVEYLDKWSCIAEKSEMGFLPMYDEYHFAGEAAIAVFMSHYRDENEAETGIKSFYKAFVRYMYCCDLEFEVHQDGYISKVLEGMGYADRNLRVALFCYRICCGQKAEKSFEFLNDIIGPSTTTNRMLKAVVDYLIDNKDVDKIEFEANEPRIYHELCAVAYGTDEVAFNEALNYISSKMGKKLKDLAPYYQQRINGFKVQSDIERARVNQTLDTGFHRYDNSSKSWIATT